MNLNRQWALAPGGGDARSVRAHFDQFGPGAHRSCGVTRPHRRLARSDPVEMPIPMSKKAFCGLGKVRRSRNAARFVESPCRRKGQDFALAERPAGPPMAGISGMGSYNRSIPSSRAVATVQGVSARLSTIESTPAMPLMQVTRSLPVWSGQAAEVGDLQLLQRRWGTGERKLEGWPYSTQGRLCHGAGTRSSARRSRELRL